MSPEDPRHGTYAGYQAGCRCQPCRDGSAAYRMSLYKRHYLEGHLKVDATGTRRRLEALIAIGYTWDAIDAELARVSGRIRRPGHSQRRWGVFSRGGMTTRDTALEYREVYERLSMTIPAETFGGKRAKLRAQRQGWAAPLAWDDDTIDDPAAEPYRANADHGHKRHSEVDEAVVIRVLSGEKLTCTKAEKDEVMRRWVASGKPAQQLAVRMGWKDGRYGRGAA